LINAVSFTGNHANLPCGSLDFTTAQAVVGIAGDPSGCRRRRLFGLFTVEIR